jgi:hypothetical protein
MSTAPSLGSVAGDGVSSLGSDASAESAASAPGTPLEKANKFIKIFKKMKDAIENVPTFWNMEDPEIDALEEKIDALSSGKLSASGRSFSMPVTKPEKMAAGMVTRRGEKVARFLTRTYEEIPKDLQEKVIKFWESKKRRLIVAIE